jgi:hypothetical protein
LLHHFEDCLSVLFLNPMYSHAYHLPMENK